MNLTWHIVAKDLRRMAAPAGLWLAFVLAASVWFRLQPFADPDVIVTASSQILVSTCGLVMIVQLLGLYVLGGALVMEDPMVSSTAFWLTRPISRRRLLRAKLLAGVVLFVVMPVLCLTAVWLGYGASLREVGVAAGQCALLHGAVLCAAVAIASLSTSLLQFMPWTLGFAVLWFVAAAWTDTLSQRALLAADMHPNDMVWHGLSVCVIAVLLVRFLLGGRGWAALAFLAVLTGVVEIRVARPYVAGCRSASNRELARFSAKRVDHRDAKPVPFAEAKGISLRDRYGAYRVPATAWVAQGSGGAAIDRGDLFQLDRVALACALAANAGAPTIEWKMIGGDAAANVRAGHEASALSGTWASAVVVGGATLKVGNAIRGGANSLVIREITRMENGNWGVLLEQRDLFTEPLWGFGTVGTDELVVVDRATRQAHSIAARLVDRGWLDWQVVKILHVTIPADALPERESDASIVQVRFRSAEPLPYVNVPGGAE